MGLHIAPWRTPLDTRNLFEIVSFNWRSLGLTDRVGIWNAALDKNVFIFGQNTPSAEHFLLINFITYAMAADNSNTMHH
jgi:hypothetical protein